MPSFGIVVGHATKEQKEPAIGWGVEYLETEEVRFDWTALLKKSNLP